MAVTVTDTRTIVNEADATTGWTSTTGGALTIFTADPTPVESTGCIGLVVSNETEGAYYTMGGGVDMRDGMLVYCWALARGAMDTYTNGGVQILLGDGTNRVGFHLAGSDKAAFRHSDGPADWQCLVLDTGRLPSLTTVFAGSLANLNLGSITQIGVVFKTLFKSVGGVSNCWIDVIRYGNDGLIVTGGTSGDPGTFAQLAAADRSVGNQQAYGIIRELGAGLYGLQGPLTFGDNAGTGASYFADTNATVVFEDRNFNQDKYKINVVGNATGSTTFRLGTKTGTGDTASGVNGCSLIAPTGVYAEFNATDADLQFLQLYGSQLVGFRMGVNLSSDATNGPNHELLGCTLRACGKADIGRVVSRNNVFTATADFRRTLSAAIQDDGGAFTDYTTAANNDTTGDVNLTPATPVNNDAFYFGHDGKFNEIQVVVSTAGTGTYAFEYWNGSTWSALTVTDGTAGFSKVGRYRITLTVPGDWATTTVNSQGPFYYARARVTAAGNQAVATRILMFGSADGSALLWNENINIKNCQINQNSDSTNDPHGIEHPSSAGSPYTYDNLTFAGNDYDIHNTSGASITINASNGSNPTTYEGTVTINNSKTFTLTGLQTGSEVRIYTYNAGDADVELAGTESSGTSFTYNYNYTGDQQIIVVIFALTYKEIRLGADGSLSLLSTNQSIPIQQQTDRNYSNP